MMTEIGRQQVRSAFEFDAIISARTETMRERKRRCLGVNRKALEQQARNSFTTERGKNKPHVPCLKSFEDVRVKLQSVNGMQKMR
jgi:hypothetical protein